MPLTWLPTWTVVTAEMVPVEVTVALTVPRPTTSVRRPLSSLALWRRTTAAPAAASPASARTVTIHLREEDMARTPGARPGAGVLGEVLVEDLGEIVARGEPDELLDHLPFLEEKQGRDAHDAELGRD